jgi:hypothetical protein
MWRFPKFICIADEVTEGGYNRLLQQAVNGGRISSIDAIASK